jgi:hypothetical protein
MNLDKHELKLLVAALAIAPAGEIVQTSLLVGVFDRPAKMNSAVASLHRCGAVLFDPYQAVIRVRADVIWKMLNEFGQQTELFTNERPLDTVLSENSRLARVLTRAACEIAPPPAIDFPRPKPPPAPPPKPDNPCVTHAFHAPHAMPELMPEHAPKPATPARLAHVHEHVVSSDLKELHGHVHEQKGTGHEVGELSRRTSAEMMTDIMRLVPHLSLENAAHWRQRIEVEDAALVNSVIRQAQLQRRSIRNVGGWMNACYLKAISAGHEKAKSV